MVAHDGQVSNTTWKWRESLETASATKRAEEGITFPVFRFENPGGGQQRVCSPFGSLSSTDISGVEKKLN